MCVNRRACLLSCTLNRRVVNAKKNNLFIVLPHTPPTHNHSDHDIRNDGI
jgi:hypothetical protein